MRLETLNLNLNVNVNEKKGGPQISQIATDYEKKEMKNNPRKDTNQLEVKK